MAVADLSPLQTRLEDLSASLKQSDAPEAWQQVEHAANAIANGLRFRDKEVDNHTNLGKSNLPQTLTDLLTIALHGAPIPPDQYTPVVCEILRVAANLCLDHDPNRGYLLDAGLPQAIVSLLEGYADKVYPSTTLSPLSLSLSHLKIVRTSIGVLLNATIGYDAVKFRLISLESALTILKLSSSIYPPLTWRNLGTPNNPLTDDVKEEWALRSGISNWAWRTVSELKEGKDDTKDDASRQILSVDILPWVTPTLSSFVPPYDLEISASLSADSEFYALLVQTDFDILEETCMLLESLSLDVEDIRLALARGYCFPAEHSGVPCLKTMVEFIEKGAYPITWTHPSITQEDRARKEKTFNICKAALIKSVVEVAGEEKNEDVLWDDSEEGQPGGEFVWTMTRWIKEYVTDVEGDPTSLHRDDLVICATLSLGNLVRREKTSTALLSPPLSLGPLLASTHVFLPKADIKLKHGVLGLLKHLAQSSTLSPIIPETLANSKIIERIASSGLWDEGIDNMAVIVQLNAIGVVKHLSNASVEHALALAVPSGDADMSPLDRIVALAARSDAVPIKNEGIRVLVNVVRTLLMKKSPKTAGDTPASSVTDPVESERKELAITNLLTEANVRALSWFLVRSGKFPILINEGVVALNLLASQRDSVNLVLDAILSPVPEIPAESNPLLSPDSDASSPTLVNKPRPAARHAVEMLANVLRNTENQAVYPVEIRANVCTFLVQLSRQSSAPKLAQVQSAIRPTLNRLVEAQSSDKEDILVTPVKKVLDLWKGSPEDAGFRGPYEEYMTKRANGDHFVAPRLYLQEIMTDDDSTVDLHVADKIATITLDRPATLNSLTQSDYERLANSLREVDARDDVLVTILRGTGNWFCSGTDVKSRNYLNDSVGNIRNSLRASVVNTTLDVGQALYSHKKILVAALNGPVMGIMAAFLGYFDFIYALPNTWLSCPFTFIGIVAEGGSSVSFVNRMGLAMAKEVLMWGKKKNAEALLSAGKVFPAQSTKQFHKTIRGEILSELEGLDPTALLTMKSLIQAGLNEKNSMDGVNLRESYAQAERMASGIPARQFARLAMKEIKHKL